MSGEVPPAPAPGAELPSTSARLFAAFLAARLAFGLAYLAGTLRRSPIPWYRPIERAWSFGGAPADGAPHLAASIAMEWYGRTAVALAAALLAGLLVWALGARGRVARVLARRPAVLALARAGGLILLVDFAYFGWVLLHPTPAPLPLPDPCLR